MFSPNYKNIVDAARNIATERMPLYEHIISDVVMEKILGTEFKALLDGDERDKKEYFKHYNDFFVRMGYDTVSFEQCITKVLPGAGALYAHTTPVIQDRADFERYPWDELQSRFFDAFEKDYEALREMMPEGMKAIGGPGNGLFEIVQDLCGYEGLCFISIDDPELYRDLFAKASQLMQCIWRKFLQRYSNTYCVLRFGDDLGFSTQTLLPEKDIRQYLIPEYKKIVEIIHGYDKPFLMHSCGRIFSIMNDLIDTVKIDAKHSNEDSIAPFSTWLDKYADRIGNFGGIDMNVLCQKTAGEIEAYVNEVYHTSQGQGGVAIGTGNSIADYVPAEGYLAMVETVNKLRI